MANKVIELHDSEIGEIIFNQNEIKIFFNSIIIHESKGKPGVDAGTVYSQKAELLFKGTCNLIGKVKLYPYLIMDGSLEVDGILFRNELPVPLNKAGIIKLILIPRNIDSEIEVTANHVSLTLIGEPEDIEDLGK